MIANFWKINTNNLILKHYNVKKISFGSNSLFTNLKQTICLLTFTKLYLLTWYLIHSKNR